MAISVERALAAVRDLCPPRYALEGDATGLQVGRGDRRIERVLTTLDLTLAVAEEARDRGAGLVVSHHALIFRPLQHLRTDDFKGRILEVLLQAEVAVYVPHTALDVVEGGMNDHLAESVGLLETRPLEETGGDGYALVVATPRDPAAATRVSQEHGARLSRGGGERLEAVLPARRAAALRRALGRLCEDEPLEVALDAPTDARGIGRVGRLAAPEPADALARRLGAALGAPGVRLVACDAAAPLERVAVLGGDGRRFLGAALRAGAQALVTGDVDHHTALEARARGLVLIDVGHWASERQVASILARGLRARLEGEPVEVLESEVDTQPFAFVSSA
ncbi:MAG: Nif3-like dinuclear metal center hexameric protein [Planctomycetota bacterium]